MSKPNHPMFSQKELEAISLLANRLRQQLMAHAEKGLVQAYGVEGGAGAAFIECSVHRIISSDLAPAGDRAALVKICMDAFEGNLNTYLDANHAMLVVANEMAEAELAEERGAGKATVH